ncbi:Transcriptional regulator ModE, partial [Haemophilus influenzae]
GLDSY